jgi:hypothetical protein
MAITEKKPSSDQSREMTQTVCEYGRMMTGRKMAQEGETTRRNGWRQWSAGKEFMESQLFRGKRRLRTTTTSAQEARKEGMLS